MPVISESTESFTLDLLGGGLINLERFPFISGIFWCWEMSWWVDLWVCWFETIERCLDVKSCGKYPGNSLERRTNRLLGSRISSDWNVWEILGITPKKTNMTMDHSPFQDVFPIEHGDFPASHVSFHECMLCCFCFFIVLIVVPTVVAVCHAA